MNVPGNALVCRELRLRQFRNFAELDLAFPAAGVAVIGDNGSGKTNLLEALYYLEIFRSFRGAPDEQLVRFGADAFFIRGRFEELASGRVREITAAYEPRTRRKRITVDGAEPDRVADAIGQLGAVVFSPSDMALVAGAPGERRRFLDIVLSLNRPGYLDALQRYRQILRQRNAQLRSGAAPAALAAWDDALVEWGTRITVARAEWVTSEAESFSRFHVAIGGGLAARLHYCAGVPIADGAAVTAAGVAQSFHSVLRRVAAREQERGLTLAGPHRDDLLVLVPARRGGDSASERRRPEAARPESRAPAPRAEIGLREYGSGGQLRTAAVALRMVEAQTIRAARGRPPLVLLDDVFAELDPGRSRRILDMLDAHERGQVILTAPKETDVGLGLAGPGFTSSLAPWHIQAGRISA